MKKVIVVCILVLTLCGCSNIQDLSHEEIIQTLEYKASRPNKYRTGYKYHLPNTMEVLETKAFNEVLSYGKYTYYLYIDALSYQNGIKNDYKTCTSCYYSKSIQYEDKYGYVEINLIENDKYLIEIMYNYAKIEVIVEKQDINKCLFTGLNILKSVKYNDNIIANLFGEDILNFAEEEFNIFNTTSSDSTYIQIDDTYVPEEEEEQDTDLLK